MRILAIDTSLTSVSACVFDGGTQSTLAEECILLRRGHAEALLPLIDRIINQIDRGFSSLDRIAVTVGPGSFTGIRVGVSAAQGLALALDIPLVGVSTLSAFAAPLVLEESDSVIVAAIDARHDNVYVQSYTPKGKTILPAQLTSARNASLLIGQGTFRMAGSAGAIVAIEAWARQLVAEPIGELHNPRIDFVARLGLSANPVYAPALPLYIKQADVSPASKTSLI